MLATSRVTLGIPGELIYEVSPLPVPDCGEEVPPGAAVRYPALALFADRAAGSRRGFAVNAENVAAVAQVCRRLDGLLGDSQFTREFQDGGKLTLDDALAYALEDDLDLVDEEPADLLPAQRTDHPALTRRESQVAALVARGLSNKEIAAQLVIARRTAESHLENILIKLGFTSRSQVAVWHALHQRATEDGSGD